MKALRWHGRQDLRVDKVPVPMVGADEVRIQIAFSGICASDVLEYLAGPIFIPLDPHPLTGSKAPQILGHEFGGYVAAAGSDVEGVSPGTLVAVDPLLSCGECWACRAGRPNLCEKLGYYGLTVDGGHTEYAVVKAVNCVPLPNGVPAEYAAFATPAAVAYHAVNQATVEPGCSVVILGGGPLGQMAAQFARQAGAGKVFITEISPSRVNLARSIGAADEVFNPMDIDVSAAVLARTNGQGADCAIECCGASKTGLFADTATQAVELTRAEGTTVVLGTFATPSEFHFNNLVLMERKVVGSWAWHSHEEFSSATAMIVDGKIDVMPLVTRKVRLDNAIADGIQALYLNGDTQSKILIDLT